MILVGELRDRETMEMVLEAAETGHLVLSSLNAPNAVKTLDRIVTAFLRPNSRRCAPVWPRLFVT